MSLSKTDILKNTIFLESKGILANRIDFAWEVYIDEANTHQVRKKALDFLIYAFDLDYTDLVNDQLIALMEERNHHKVDNPEFIPRKAPGRLLFDPTAMVLEKADTFEEDRMASVEEAIKEQTLLVVNERSFQLDQEKNTIFLTAEQRALYRVHLSQGLFVKDGNPFDTSDMIAHKKKGFAAFTMNIHGELSVFNHLGMRDNFAHSSMNAGLPVVFAGEIQIKQGKLLAINTHSGHYKPSLFNTTRALEYFEQQGIDISEAKVITFNNPAEYLKVTSEAVYYPAYGKALYETPAHQIYQKVEGILEENIQSIHEKIMIYCESGLFSLLFSLKDKIIGSELTAHRAILANGLNQHIIDFQNQLKRISLKDYPDAIKKLEAEIATYESKNTKLSSEYNKASDSGRLAHTIHSFKEQLKDLKQQANEIAHSDISKVTKNIN